MYTDDSRETNNTAVPIDPDDLADLQDVMLSEIISGYKKEAYESM